MDCKTYFITYSAESCPFNNWTRFVSSIIQNHHQFMLFPTLLWYVSKFYLNETNGRTLILQSTCLTRTLLKSLWIGTLSSLPGIKTMQISPSMFDQTWYLYVQQFKCIDNWFLYGKNEIRGQPPIETMSILLFNMSRTLCDSEGNIGEKEFESVMRQHLITYTQVLPQSRSVTHKSIIHILSLPSSSSFGTKTLSIYTLPCSLIMIYNIK
jgi:hypothetical protein